MKKTSSSLLGDNDQPKLQSLHIQGKQQDQQYSIEHQDEGKEDIYREQSTIIMKNEPLIEKQPIDVTALDKQWHGGKIRAQKSKGTYHDEVDYRSSFSSVDKYGFNDEYQSQYVAQTSLNQNRFGASAINEKSSLKDFNQDQPLQTQSQFQMTEQAQIVVAQQSMILPIALADDNLLFEKGDQLVKQESFLIKFDDPNPNINAYVREETNRSDPRRFQAFEDDEYDESEFSGGIEQEQLQISNRSHLDQVNPLPIYTMNDQQIQVVDKLVDQAITSKAEVEPLQRQLTREEIKRIAEDLRDVMSEEPIEEVSERRRNRSN
ncbi:hypothetical protein FGO68_gene9226 [Halteria grandinella]|uniref:Uncharacterized protein n=1 Tax=Halteria grandinella TaxID=5974 RepID=A0A8J8P6R9_HALGN|nr:hypothetical protein FGO68_gene9226 [Halteria grandinella]